MIGKPDDTTLQALARMGKSAEWPVIRDWLMKGREELVQMSLNPDNAKSRQAQGALMAIDEIAKLTTAAVESSTSR